jgi:hypothetical protein
VKPLLFVTAAFEAGIGISLMAAPSMVARLLLGATLDAPAALTVARVAGTALLALGIVCWFAASDTQSRAARGALNAMTLYNLGAAIILGLAGIQSQPSGIGLWPTVALHAAMTIWCVTTLLRKAATPAS